MKAIQIMILLFCITLGAQNTQSKVGTIDIDFILAQMPELEGVQKTVTDYGQTLDADLTSKMEAYQALVNEYAANDVTYTINQRKTMQDSIMNTETSINKFRQNAQQLISLKRDEVLQPLYQKIGASLEKVAKQLKYTQVMERTSNIVYIDNNFDLTLGVLQDMGIEIKQEE